MRCELPVHKRGRIEFVQRVFRNRIALGIAGRNAADHASLHRNLHETEHGFRLGCRQGPALPMPFRPVPGELAGNDRPVRFSFPQFLHNGLPLIFAGAVGDLLALGVPRIIR